MHAGCIAGKQRSLREIRTAWCVRWSGDLIGWTRLSRLADWLRRFTGRRGSRLRTTLMQSGAMIALNEAVIRHSKDFYSYPTPTDFRLEDRYPQLFPTNVRPETLAKDAKLNERARLGKAKHAQFLRFTSPERTIHPENDLVNARWYPAPPEKMAGKPKQAVIVMPQWNADAFSHNALCSLFNGSVFPR